MSLAPWCWRGSSICAIGESPSLFRQCVAGCGGEAIPAQDKLLVLADWLRVDPQVLRFGTQAGQGARGVKEELRPNADEENMLRAYRRLPMPQRQALHEIITSLAKAGPPDA